MNDPAIKEAVNHEMEFSKSFIEWRLYEQQEKAIKDKIGIERYNRRIGREEGRKEGRQEGIKEGSRAAQIAMAKSMLSDGVNIDFIIKYTKLSKDEIEQLASLK